MLNSTFDNIISELDNFDAEVDATIELLSKTLDIDALSSLFSIYQELYENNEEHFRENQSVHAANIDFIYNTLKDIADYTDELNRAEFIIERDYPDDDYSINHRRTLFLEAFRLDFGQDDSNHAYTTGAGRIQNQCYDDIHKVIVDRWEKMNDMIEETLTFTEKHPNAEKTQDLIDALDNIDAELPNILIDLADSIKTLYSVLHVSDEPVEIRNIIVPQIMDKRYFAKVYNEDI